MPTKLSRFVPVLLTAPLAVGAYFTTILIRKKQVPVGVGRNLWQDGVLARGESRRHTTTLYNATNYPIRIADYVNTAGADVSFDRRVVPAHEEALVTLTVKPNAKPGTWVCGTDIYFEGRINPITLKAFGKVVDLAPPTVNAGDLFLNKEKSLTFPLKTRSGQALRVTKVLYNSGRLDVRVETHMNSSEAYIRVLPQSTPGRLDEAITFVVGNEAVPQVMTKITGDRLPYVFAEPSALSLGVVHDAAKTLGEITLRSPYGKRFTIKSVTLSTHSDLRVTKQAKRPDSTQALAVEWNHLTASASLDARIRIMVIVEAEKQMQTFEVPIYGFYTPVEGKQ